MRNEEIEYELKSLLATRAPFFTPNEAGAIKLAIKHVARSDRYRVALKKIEQASLSSLVAKICVEAFDMEDE